MLIRKHECLFIEVGLSCEYQTTARGLKLHEPLEDDILFDWTLVYVHYCDLEDKFLPS